MYFNLRGPKGEVALIVTGVVVLVVTVLCLCAYCCYKLIADSPQAQAQTTGNCVYSIIFPFIPTSFRRIRGATCHNALFRIKIEKDICKPRPGTGCCATGEGCCTVGVGPGYCTVGLPHRTGVLYFGASVDRLTDSCKNILVDLDYR